MAGRVVGYEVVTVRAGGDAAGVVRREEHAYCAGRAVLRVS